MIVHTIKFVRQHAAARYGAGLATGALLFGGGYAIAAGGTKTIHGCVDNKTNVLHVKARCGRGQHRLIWNQQGPAGVQGATGATGGAAPSAWALVGSDGSLPFGGHNITVQRTGIGTYTVQATASGCPDGNTAPVVTPLAGTPSGAVPSAWVSGAPGRNFLVYTGSVSGGVFTPADRSFDVSVPCS